MDNFIISKIRARQVLDSRGNPTVEAEVFLDNGGYGRAIVPSGASTGSGEALELRDKDPNCFGGKGVLKAVWNVNSKINDVLAGNSSDQRLVDQMMCELDGTENKSSLGANAILAVSLANAKANARAMHIPFYRYVADLAGTVNQMSIPMPMMNVMNGGEHASWATDFQEYMIIPRSAGNIANAVRMGAEVFHNLKSILKEKGLSCGVGDEGGFAPNINSTFEALDLICSAINKAGYVLGSDIFLGLDVAASEFYKDGIYHFEGCKYTKEELLEFYVEMVNKYPVISIEDGMAEQDYEGWKILTDKLGNKIQLVGDDLFVTNKKLLQKGIDLGIANAILIKLNQIGTVTETLDTIKLAKENGYKTIISHRSGETEDNYIADFAVALELGQIKTGSLSRSDRLSKYNRLTRIEENL